MGDLSQYPTQYLEDAGVYVMDAEKEAAMLLASVLAMAWSDNKGEYDNASEIVDIY